jgi:hypothetical protein
LQKEYYYAAHLLSTPFLTFWASFLRGLSGHCPIVLWVFDACRSHKVVRAARAPL